MPYESGSQQQYEDADDLFLQHLTQAQAAPRPRPSSVANSRRESRSVFQGLQDILADAPSNSSTQSKEQLLSAVLDLDQYPSQRKLAEKAIKRQTFHALDSELDQVQEDLIHLSDSLELWQYASRRIARAQADDAVASEMYPQLVLLLFDRLPAQLQLPFFTFVSTISTESFVYGCTPQLFARVMRLQWQRHTDVQAALHTLNTMLNAGIQLNHHIRDTIHEINMAIEADAQKATEEAVEALSHAAAAPPPPQFSFADDVAPAQSEETARIRAEAARRRRFGPAEQEAAQSMQAILAAEPLDLDVEVSEPSFERPFSAPESRQNEAGPGLQRATVAFDEWLKQTEEMAQQHQRTQRHQKSSRSSRHPHLDSSEPGQYGVYLHPRPAPS